MLETSRLISTDQETSRPDTFQRSFVASRNVPYVCGDGFSGEGYHSGGVLSRGKTVWTTADDEAGKHPQRMVAFVEGLGIVSLDSHWLVRADANRK